MIKMQEVQKKSRFPSAWEWTRRRLPGTIGGRAGACIDLAEVGELGFQVGGEEYTGIYVM
jgi:hypothetical protein